MGGRLGFWPAAALAAWLSCIMPAMPCCRAAGQEPQDAPAPVPGVAGEVAPAEGEAGVEDAEAAEAERRAERERKARQAQQRARTRALELFYQAAVTFKDFQPTAVQEASQHFGYGQANDLGMRFSVDKKVLELDAVLVDPGKGLFVMADPAINLSSVARMELEGRDGKVYRLQLVGVGRRCHAWLLRAEGFATDVAAPQFRNDVIHEGAAIMVADTTSFGDFLDVLLRGMRLGRFLAHGDDLMILNLGGLPGNLRPNWPVANHMIFDEEGGFGGLAFSELLVRRGETRNYLERWSEKEDWLDVSELAAMGRGVLGAIASYTPRVRFRFEQSGSGVGAPAGGRRELFVYGLAVGEDRVFLAGDMDAALVASIDTISVQLPNGQEVPAEFLGLYREFGGVLLECEGKLPFPADLWEERDVPDMALFFDVAVKQRFGRKDAVMKYNRFFGTDTGYKDKEFRTPVRPFLPGSFVLDSRGRFYGFATMEKRYETVMRLKSDGRDGGQVTRCYTFADMKDRFVAPSDYFDPRVKVKDIQERKELAWLGVEFQPVTPGLAMELGIEKETRDGREGLLINMVYPGSPAAKMGFRPGDVLLKMQVVGKGGEIALRLPPDYGRRPDVRGVFASRGAAAYVDRRWFSRSNPLTQTLTTAVGVGQRVRLTYGQDHEVKTVDFTVEKAPADLRSAAKYKCEWTGLTVKDVTYDVRNILRLGAAFSGVVVYEVEAGSPAAIGRIQPMEFILQVEGESVAGAERFRALISKLAAEGRKDVTLKVRNLDQTRFVQVELERSDEREAEAAAGMPSQGDDAAEGS